MILIVGLGSMGKRRARCLVSLGRTNFVGVDVRQDRRIAFQDKFQCRVYESMEQAIADANPTTALVCTPPLTHHSILQKLCNEGISCFVEAGVCAKGYIELERILEHKGVKVIPSATLLFHPAIRKISDLLQSERLGKLASFQYYSGQYLPDWHPYESVADYYVSIPECGGAKEIFPFEMTWVVSLFGFPATIAGKCRKTINILGAEGIQDTYLALLDFGDMIGSIHVDVVSLEARRILILNGERGQLQWDANQPHIRIFWGDTRTVEYVPIELSAAAEGYHPSITEIMYIDELNCALQAIEGRMEFPNSLCNDRKVLEMLNAIEGNV